MEEGAPTTQQGWPEFWKIRTKTVIRRIVICALLAGGWIALGRFGVVTAQAFDAGTLVIATLLFFAGIPLSFYLRVDEAASSYGLVVTEHKLAFALGVAAINIAVWTFAWGALKKALGRDGPRRKKSRGGGRSKGAPADSAVKRSGTAPPVEAKTNGRPQKER